MSDEKRENLKERIQILTDERDRIRRRVAEDQDYLEDVGEDIRLATDQLKGTGLGERK